METRKNTMKYAWILFVLGLSLLKCYQEAFTCALRALIVGMIGLVLGSCFFKPHHEDDDQNHEYDGRKSKIKKIETSLLSQIKIESTQTDAIDTNNSMITITEKILTKSYEKIMKKHFRSTSSSNVSHKPYPKFN
jgi:hypothetical protein